MVYQDWTSVILGESDVPKQHFDNDIRIKKQKKPISQRKRDKINKILNKINEINRKKKLNDIQNKRNEIHLNDRKK